MSESMTVDMTPEQAIEFAREWQKGLTVYPGAMGWRVVCMVLADEVERLQARVAELEAALQQQVAVADNANKLNSDLCSRAFSLEQERDELLSRLPDGMKHCTIVFKECEKGHGWLTATNWAQHGCPTCERDELRRQNDDLILKQFDHIGSGNKAVRRIKAAAVREACDKVVANYSMCHEDKSGNVYLNITAIRDYADQIEGGA